jgi:hypothetical protein
LTIHSQRLGRLATVDGRGAPQNNPVGFFIEEATGQVLIGGFNLAQSRKVSGLPGLGAPMSVRMPPLPWKAIVSAGATGTLGAGRGACRKSNADIRSFCSASAAAIPGPSAPKSAAPPNTSRRTGPSRVTSGTPAALRHAAAPRVSPGAAP